MTADDVSFSSAITSCEKGGQWVQTLALLDKMCSAGMTADELSFSSVRERGSSVLNRSWHDCHCNQLQCSHLVATFFIVPSTRCGRMAGNGAWRCCTKTFMTQYQLNKEIGCHERSVDYSPWIDYPPETSCLMSRMTLEDRSFLSIPSITNMFWHTRGLFFFDF